MPATAASPVPTIWSKYLKPDSNVFSSAGKLKSLSTKGFSTLNNSTSKINVELGGIEPIGREPYPKFGGIINLNFEPTGINCRPSVQPLITLFNGKVTVSPLSTEESKTVPSSSVP